MDRRAAGREPSTGWMTPQREGRRRNSRRANSEDLTMNTILTQTIPGPRRPDLAVPDAGRGGARRRVVLLYARRKTLLRPGRRSIGEQRRALQSCRREGRTGTGRALHARHGLRRAGRDAAGGVCLQRSASLLFGRVVESSISSIRAPKRSKGRSKAGQTLSPDARSWSPCGVPTTGRPTGR